MSMLLPVLLLPAWAKHCTPLPLDGQLPAGLCKFRSQTIPSTSSVFFMRSHFMSSFGMMGFSLLPQRA